MLEPIKCLFGRHSYHSDLSSKVMNLSIYFYHKLYAQHVFVSSECYEVIKCDSPCYIVMEKGQIYVFWTFFI